MVDKKGKSSNLAMRLGRNIAARRKQLAWTQDQLAERVEVDAETISRFERGAHLPSLPTLDRLATVMQVTLGDLAMDSTPVKIEESAVISAWMQDLSAENRRFILNVIRECCEHLRRN